MQPRFHDKKQQIIFFTILIMFAAWLGMFLSLAATPGYDLVEWRNELTTKYVPMLKENLYGLKNPLWFKPYINDYTMRFIVSIEIITITFIIYVWYFMGDYIHKKEFGTSKWANPAEVSKSLRAKKLKKNKIHVEYIPKRRFLCFIQKKKQ